MPETVLRYRDINPKGLKQLLGYYQLVITKISDGQAIPGSFWGDDEAGLINNCLYLRSDTPIHSILHEASHYICMDESRRQNLHTDAGSDNAEESAVCYLQILLANHLPNIGLDRILYDMDSWGYSFRLGSTRTWFEKDAGDSYNWLVSNQLIDSRGALQFYCR